MNKPVLFIADLHLNDQHQESYLRFQKFLKNKARNARALYILGDLFEYYLGDDAISLSKIIDNVILDLKELSITHNVNCYFMAGNRDFLVGNAFSQLSGVQILNDPTIITLDDKNIILTHADQLCTDDTEYQKVRLQIRSSQWQQWFLNLSIPERIEFAQQARIKSKKHTQSISNDIMDVNQSAVNQLFKQYDTAYMLHGHTHRPAFHQVTINHTAHLRMVLGDWHHQISYIEYKNNNFQLVTC